MNKNRFSFINKIPDNIPYKEIIFGYYKLVSPLILYRTGDCDDIVKEYDFFYKNNKIASINMGEMTNNEWEYVGSYNVLAAFVKINIDSSLSIQFPKLLPSHLIGFPIFLYDELEKKYFYILNVASE